MPYSQNGWPLDPPRSARTPGTNSDAHIVVADGPAGDILMYVATQFDLRVEDLEAAGPEDEWGYAHRYIGGTTTWSNHASATAIDLNATRHPQGKRGTFSPTQVSAIRAILHECQGLIRWGGDYSGTVDEMHFEIVGSYAAVESWVRGQSPRQPNRPTIKQGSTGGYVRDLQRVLNAWYPTYSPRLVVDGDFGPRTAAFVRYAQERLGLAVDGIVGPKTWFALGFR